MMPPEQQRRVFCDPPDGSRLIVVATNVAETSITIPNIRYVVDTGRQKIKTCNVSTGVSKFEVAWVSQAQAEQRKGRAGRTGPGHCYRLYSANFFDQHMLPFSPPEITNVSLDGLLLQMKSIGITDVSSFPFPTRPPEKSMTAAVAMLMNIGALARSSPSSNRPAHMTWLMSGKENQLPEESITSLGKLLSQIPISPRLGKMLVFAHRSGNYALYMHTLSLIAVLSDISPFTQGNNSAATAFESQKNAENDSEYESDSSAEAKRENEKKAKLEASLWWHASGDSFARLRTLGAYSFTLATAAAAGAAAVAKVLKQEATHQRQLEKKSKPNPNTVSSTSIESTQNAENAFVFSSLTSRRSIFMQVTAAGITEFCKNHSIMSIILDRSLELRAQLADRCEQVLGPVPNPSPTSHSADDSIHSSLYANAKHRAVLTSARIIASLPPPTLADEVALSQLLVLGFCDHVAKKVPVGVLQHGTRRQRLTAYQSANPAVLDLLYIHPQSALYSSDPTAQLPEYIIYDNLVRNERGDQVYMATISVIDSAWLARLLGPAMDGEGGLLCPASPLLQISAPLTTPLPVYDKISDDIMCYVVPAYGNHKWELPATQKPMQLCAHDVTDELNTSNTNTPIGFRKQDVTVRWFARCLLEGRVSLGEITIGSNLFHVSYCREPPSTLTDMKPVPRVTNLLRLLVKEGVHNKRTLIKCILENRQKQENYLLEELQAFIHVEQRKEFKKKWLRLCASL